MAYPFVIRWWCTALQGAATAAVATADDDEELVLEVDPPEDLNKVCMPCYSGVHLSACT
jgi:hypothetical protein